MVDLKKLEIVHYPHEVLSQKAQPVAQITDEVKQVAEKMIALMHEAQGVGLAAPQVGLNWRMFVVNPSHEPDADEVFINPVITQPTGDLEPFEEGCLSLPGVRVEVKRPKGVTIEATDLEGNRFTKTSTEFEARVWQHEFDHLEGVLILSKMGPVDRIANRRAIQDLEGLSK